MRLTNIFYSTVIAAVFSLSALFTSAKTPKQIKPGIGFSWKIKR